MKESFAFESGHNNLTLTVKSDVDTADVEKRLTAIVTDKGLQDRIAGQQQQIRQLEQQVQALNSRLSVAPVSSTGELRKERNIVFGNIEELENRKLAAIRAITEKTDLIQKYIVPRMTMDEVKGILGNPRTYETTMIVNKTCCWIGWNYGEMWIFFQENIVSCVSRTRDAC